MLLKVRLLKSAVKKFIRISIVHAISTIHSSTFVASPISSVKTKATGVTIRLVQVIVCTHTSFTLLNLVSGLMIKGGKLALNPVSWYTNYDSSCYSSGRYSDLSVSKPNLFLLAYSFSLVIEFSAPLVLTIKRTLLHSLSILYFFSSLVILLKSFITCLFLQQHTL